MQIIKRIAKYLHAAMVVRNPAGNVSLSLLNSLTNNTDYLEFVAGQLGGVNGSRIRLYKPAASTDKAIELLVGTTAIATWSQSGVMVGPGLPDRQLHAEQESAATNTVTYLGRFTSTSSGTPANGIGVGLEFEVETAAGNNEIGATIEAVARDVTAASEDFDLVGKIMVGGAAPVERFRFGQSHTSLGGIYAEALPSPADNTFPHVFLRPQLAFYNTASGSTREYIAFNSYLSAGITPRAVFTGSALRVVFSAVANSISIESAPSVAAGAAQTFTSRFTFPLNGRQWTSVTGSRSIGTVFQNTSGGEREVSASVSVDATGTAILEIDTVNPPAIEVGRAFGGIASSHQLTGTVPNNGFYRIRQSIATVTLLSWSELN